MIEQYLAHHSNYLDGIIINYWVSNKAEKCMMIDAKEVAQFICQFLFIII